jgi:DNA polymerase-3 subunit epsilon
MRTDEDRLTLCENEYQNRIFDRRFMRVCVCGIAMREVVLDTETTGLSFADGDKIVEIGCVELIDKKVTGKTFHAYVNPEREVSKRATEISGLTYEFLKKYGVFVDIYEEFMTFIGEDRLIIHNAQFDIGFLNFELSLVSAATLDPKNVVDTLAMAREKYPGSPSSLDALCRRFSINSAARTKHGALIDAELLAEVYISMSVEVVQRSIMNDAVRPNLHLDERQAFNGHRKFSPNQEELRMHEELMKKINSPIWKIFFGGR